MGTFNNIGILEQNNISGAGTVSFGNTINIAAQYNQKYAGSASIIGDFGAIASKQVNEFNDHDVNDQVTVRSKLGKARRG
ncbi:spore germination protein [Salinithrix halophila]|uniref:Spore germination protein n=1 Tax=Salinithrix halophila TaxID=1485204 RepID=A0ABV8JMF1_9BACL